MSFIKTHGLGTACIKRILRMKVDGRPKLFFSRFKRTHLYLVLENTLGPKGVCVCV